MAELAYAADLKSAAFGLVGSSPTAPTSSFGVSPKNAQAFLGTAVYAGCIRTRTLESVGYDEH